MLNIFIAAIAGVVIGIILVKYWHIITSILSSLQDGIEFICSLPLNFISSCTCTNRISTTITYEYDCMFFKIKTPKKCQKHMRKIIKLERIKLKCKIKNHIRQTKQLLNKAKWVI